MHIYIRNCACVDRDCKASRAGGGKGEMTTPLGRQAYYRLKTRDNAGDSTEGEGGIYDKGMESTFTPTAIAECAIQS